VEEDVGAEIGLDGGGLGGVEIVIDADDGVAAAFDDEEVGGLRADFVGAVFEVEDLVTPNLVGEPGAGGDFGAVGGGMGPAFASGVKIKEVFEKDLRGAIDGEGDGVGGPGSYSNKRAPLKYW
jgi:hypothetical protein